MADLKTRLKNDLTVAMKARETVTAGALRMALTAVTNEEVSGKQARVLSDDEVVKVLSREAKKRKEAAEAFDGAGRAEKADLERQELAVLEIYLPAQLGDAELASIVDKAFDAVAAQLGEAPGQKQMGQVMKAVNAEVAGRAEGGRVAAAVKAKLDELVNAVPQRSKPLRHPGSERLVDRVRELAHRPELQVVAEVTGRLRRRAPARPVAAAG